MSEVWSANFVLLSITDVAYFLFVPLLATSPFLSVPKHKVKHCDGRAPSKGRGEAILTSNSTDRIHFEGGLTLICLALTQLFFPLFSFPSSKHRGEKLLGTEVGCFHPPVWKHRGERSLPMTWGWVDQPWPVGRPNPDQLDVSWQGLGAGQQQNPDCGWDIYTEGKRRATES